MRHLSEYILESEKENQIRIKDVKFTYTAKKHDLTVQVPDSYSEDDMQIYVNDMVLSKLPGGAESTNNIFGPNLEFITDAYIEYDRFETALDAEAELEWDSHYDTTNAKYNHLIVYKLINLRYVLVMSEFDMQNIDERNIKTELYDVIKTTESNNANKYPFDIEIKKENVEYKSYEQIEQ